MNWESISVPNVDERYFFHVMARLPNVAVLKNRLVRDCYGRKRHFAELVLGELARRFKSTIGQIAFASLGWVGWKELGFGSKIPTVRGDGLVIVRRDPHAKDHST